MNSFDILCVSSVCTILYPIPSLPPVMIAVFPVWEGVEERENWCAGSARLWLAWLMNARRNRGREAVFLPFTAEVFSNGVFNIVNESEH